MKRYRYKHTVEALQWHDTDRNRELFYAWFEMHGVVFETRGPDIVLPDGETVEPGEWVLWSDYEFVAMYDHVFREDYEEVQS